MQTTMINATVSANGTHFILKSEKELSGRGVSFLKMTNGKFKYKVTQKAYDKISADAHIVFHNSFC